MGNRAPTDASIEGVVFYQFSLGETSGKQGPTGASIGGHCVLLI